MKRFVFVIFLAFVVTSVAQDTNYVRQTLRQLTSESMHGRGYSWKGDSVAAQFIRNELRRFRLQPLGDDYYQNYTFDVFSMEGPLWVKFDGKQLVPYEEFRVSTWSKSSWGEFKVLKVPAETLMDAAALKKILKKHDGLMEDLFIYIDATQFRATNEAEGKRFVSQIQSLQRRNPFNSRGIIVGVNQLSTCSMSYSNFEHGYAYIEVLASSMPKKVKKLNCSIFTQFHKNYKTQNVCALMPGEVDTMIVFTAHYDHLGTMGDSVVFNGAHDNASGVAAVLDLARMSVYEKPHYTYVFCFFSGEEAGLMGSKYAAEHPLFDFSKVRLLVNIDMFCGGDEGLMVFNAEAEETKPFVERIVRLNDALQIAPEIRKRENRPNSDHYYFSQHVPALFFLTMGQRYGGYHDPYDTCERCGLEHYLNYITLISSLGL